ncbi:ABC transporter permease [Bifidobacterium sp. GSD1FS]|uniref:ABC transporter permease n=1 Tax=Bifidobacterium canis TaxID=2610880 RepID=A0A7K1J2S8_9BIFI|nr:ABC transporter permease [Bifidobacterium canis]
MIRIGLRDARAHMRRFVMSIIAIALGVSFVVGSFCFREMLNDQVSQMMGTNSDHDVYVRGATEQKNDADSTSSTSSSSITTYNEISTDLVKSLEKVKGVASASVTYSISGVVLLDHDGNAVSTVGAPTLLIGADAQQPWRSANFVSGSYAKTDSEVALNEEAANKAGVTTGDSTRIVIDGEPHDVTVSGVFSTSNSQLGALLVLGQPSMVEHYLQQEGTSTTQTQYIAAFTATIQRR